MSEGPEVNEIVEGVSRFLGTQILPALDDRGLSFRLRIALYLMEVVHRDMETRDIRVHAQWQRLVKLLNANLDIQSPHESLQIQLKELNQDLVTRIRQGDYESLRAERAHIMETLTEELGVVQPRFNLDFDCEQSPTDGE